jgi:hypothetical protein
MMLKCQEDQEAANMEIFEEDAGTVFLIQPSYCIDDKVEV